MHRSCAQCLANFEITDEDLAFIEKVSPVYGGTKELIPPPTLCPQCRVQRRMAFRNQIYVYTRPSSATGKQMFSMYTPEAPVKVFENELWYGDSWDPMEFGRPFDFNRTFFDQFLALFRDCPLPARAYIPEMINSDYSNNVMGVKNSYLIFNASFCEDCMYCESIWGTKDAIDCTRVPESELCYDCTACSGYNLQSSYGSLNCSDSFFLHNCIGCKHCFGCANLARREYCVFNEQKTKEEYEAFLKSVDLQSYAEREKLRAKWMTLAQSLPQPAIRAHASEDVSGNWIRNSKSVHESLMIANGENLKYCYSLDGHGNRDCMDVTLWGEGIELCYESSLVGVGSSNLIFCYYLFGNCSNLTYCSVMGSCSNCFACVGLRNKKYCIFNVQYTEEAYNAMVPEIIDHMRENNEWGEHVPITFSPIPYNQSLAQRYFSLTKDEARARGALWYVDHREPGEGIAAKDLPDRLPATDDVIIVKSALSDRPFKITSEEIKRYRQFNVPLPRLTYDERMEARMRRMGGLKLYDRTCAKTGKPIHTTTPPDSPLILWDYPEWEKEFWG